MGDNEETKYDLTEVFRDPEGWYRWTYEVDSRTNKSFLNLYYLIFALVILIPGMILFFMIYGHDIGSGYFGDAGKYLLIMLAVLAAAELLTYVVYKLVEKARGGTTPIPYAMDEDCVITHAGNTRTPQSYLQTDFRNVKDVKLDPGSDLIILNEILRVTHVYVPREDLPFVLNFILCRVPQTEQIIARREEYKVLTEK